MTEDEIVGWHHQLSGHGFGWTLGVGNGHHPYGRMRRGTKKPLDESERGE